MGVCVGAGGGLTQKKHAGVGGSQAVGGEAGVVAIVLLCHVGKEKQGARLLVLDPEGVITLDRSTERGKGRRKGSGYKKKKEKKAIQSFYHTSGRSPSPACRSSERSLEFFFRAAPPSLLISPWC